jgi:hypothetical protein
MKEPRTPDRKKGGRRWPRTAQRARADMDEIDRHLFVMRGKNGKLRLGR